MKIVFASTNSGKIFEIQKLLSELNWQVIPQKDLGVNEIPETGFTFVENALIKARHASQITGLPAIADDSGLEVDALKGAPGIFSARYAGKNASSEENIKKLLQELESVPESQRQARFHCVIVFLRHAEDPTPLICDGIWEGKILTASRGEKGFGYDPVFFDPEKNCSAAELPIELKNQLSHRGKALRMLIDKLKKTSY